MISSVSARNALLTASSINALVTDRELYTVAASVVPKLRSVLEHRKDMVRSSNVWHTPLVSTQEQSPCWVLHKKQSGVKISEFDRAKHSTMRHMDHSSWFRGSSRVADARHSMIESRDSLYSCDAMIGDHTQSEIRAQQLLQWPTNDLNVTYAVSAQVTLNCRLNEAMTMLFSRETLQFDASMNALFGAKKYKSGELLVSREYQKKHAMEDDTGRLSSFIDDDVHDISQPGWIALQSVVLRSRRSLNPITAAKHTSRHQRLCFAAYSQLCPDSNEAFYTMQTLPKPMHDTVTGRKHHRGSEQALRGDLDHIAAGYHLMSTYSDLSGHQTRVVMTAYVYNPHAPDPSRARSKFWTKGSAMDHGNSVSNRRHYARPTANAQAKYVVNLLATATTSFEHLVRRRRLGYQPFVQTPASLSPSHDSKCSVCLRTFGLLRSHRFCQLCAQRVCRECSRNFDVEPVARRVRRARICFACVASVDASVFNPDNPLLKASFSKLSIKEAATTKKDREDDAGDAKISTAFYDMALHTADNSRTSQFTKETSTLQTTHETLRHRLDRSKSATTPPASTSSTSGRQLADALFSSDPLTRARALESVRQVVHQVTSNFASTCPSSPSSTLQSPVSVNDPQTIDGKLVDKYLEARLHLSNILVQSKDTTAKLPRDDMHCTRSHYLNDSQEGIQRRRCNTSGQCFPYSNSKENTIAPRPWATTPNLETELDLDDDLDSAALNSICEVAAIRMRCSMAYIVAYNGAHNSHAQRVVGSFGAPCQWTEEVSICPFSFVANGKPFVIKEPASEPELQNLQLVRDFGVQFIAGFPIKSPDGVVCACLCTVDTQAREKIVLMDLKAMQALSKLASDLFEEEVNPYTPRY